MCSSDLLAALCLDGAKGGVALGQEPPTRKKRSPWTYPTASAFAVTVTRGSRHRTLVRLPSDTTADSSVLALSAQKADQQPSS